MRPGAPRGQQRPERRGPGRRAELTICSLTVTEAARALTPLTPGATVGERYLVRRVLGTGGMGQVLEVEHLALGRPFALKVLRLEKWNDELVRRFHREARALAKITTPRVAQVTDFGVDAQVGPFYVMELLDGETLEDRIERDTIVAPREALTICAELCEALAEVHAAGIVHRDLKPSNVGLPKSGPVGVKLLDFGLAAAMDDAFLSKITQSNQILGSLPYMAPEQFGTHEPGPPIDIYAVGVVLYETLAGRLPFIAPSTAALIHQILAMPPPPLPADLARFGPLEGLLERFLAKEAGQRFATATAAAHALRDAAEVLFGAAKKQRVHPPTRSLEESTFLPTLEARAIDASSVSQASFAANGQETGPLGESGMRIAHPVAAMAHSPPSLLPQAAPAGPRMSLAIALVVGFVLALVAAVSMVVVLELVDRRRDPIAPPQALAPAPVPAPIAPQPVTPPIPEPPVPQPPAPEPVAEQAPAPERIRERPRPTAVEEPPTERPPTRWRGGTIGSFDD
jgi:serine/threonine protein kinase